jgi:solute carrier family 25 carnitine/acylcarnitine transporter 20/29
VCSNAPQNMSADFWAGYISGAAGILIGNPLDLVKTRLQAGNATPNVESGSIYTASTPTTVTRRSFTQHFDRAGTLVKGEDKLLLLPSRSGANSRMVAQALQPPS